MRAQKRLATGKGGIIWHTQGSGKSLTMIWLSKWLLANIPTARVLVVTDRDELDEQIEKNFKVSAKPLSAPRAVQTCWLG